MRASSIVIDTNVFLSARDPSEPGHAESRRLLEAADAGKIRALVSVITVAELRAGFTAAQLPALWTPFLSHLRASPTFSIEPVDEAVALAAGELRSESRIHLPDALILATALHRGADCVATQDRTLLRTRTSVLVKRPAEVIP